MGCVKERTAGIISFLGYDVLKIDFKKNENYNGESVELDTDLSVNIRTNKDNSKMAVEMTIKIFDDEKMEYPFRLEVIVVGQFESDGDVKNNVREFQANAVAILFPYVRALVTNCTANANVVPLILPTINNNNLVKNSIH